jgi:spermidine synthase
VIPWEHLDSATMPGGGGELRLMRRGAEYSIMAGGVELMNSRLSGSEEALATLACARLADRPAPRILIGGLGMGFTLRAALGVLGPDARVEVAELVPAVAQWARGPMAAIFAGCLDDPRTDLQIADVRALIGSARAAYDAILLDIDNGPAGLTRGANDGLYGEGGLRECARALRSGGVLAVWSAAPDERFEARLQRCGFAVMTERVRANGKGRGARHVIWVATSESQGG